MKSTDESLLSKKELDLLHSSLPSKLKFQPPERLKKLITLVRKLRDKYRGLNRRQKAYQKTAENHRTIQKIKIFENMLAKFEKQYQWYQSRILRKQIRIEDGLNESAQINLAPKPKMFLGIRLTGARGGSESGSNNAFAGTHIETARE